MARNQRIVISGDGSQPDLGQTPGPARTTKRIQRITYPKRRCAAPGCKVRFRPRRSTQVYCSDACRRAGFVQRRRELAQVGQP